MSKQISAILNPSLCDSKAVYQKFRERLSEGRLTRDENLRSHYCIYFFPYNHLAKKVFVVHHKKSGLWLSPGGHIDEGEVLLETLNREVREELGVAEPFQELAEPFLLSITPIGNNVQPCREHFDIWYPLFSDGADFNVDLKEFHATRWVTIAEARSLFTDPNSLKALGLIQKSFD